MIKYVVNSNVQFFELPAYDGLVFQCSYLSHSFGIACTVTVQSSDFVFPAFQFFVNHSIGKATLYGLYFRFCELWGFDWRGMYEDISIHLWFPVSDRLIRADFKVDILGVSVGEFMRKLSKKEPVHSRNQIAYSKKWELETMYLGAKWSKYAYGRVYDKTKDNEKKWKQVFYSDYPTPTTRVEIQCGCNFVGDLCVNDRLTKILSYVWYQFTYWHWSYYVGKRYNPNFILDKNRFKKQIVKSLVKASNNWLDLSQEFALATEQQPFYIFSVTSKWQHNSLK